jgi:hypothetical protein
MQDFMRHPPYTVLDRELRRVSNSTHRPGTTIADDYGKDITTDSQQSSISEGGDFR